MRTKGKKVTKREGKKQEKIKEEAGRRMDESRRRNWLGLCWSKYPHSHRPCLAPHGHQFRFLLRILQFLEAGHMIGQSI